MTMKFTEQQKCLAELAWSPNSPDHNRIENLCGMGHLDGERLPNRNQDRDPVDQEGAEVLAGSQNGSIQEP